MRRLLICMASAACAIGALSSCGSSSPGSGSLASTPAVQALSYFPPATPFVLTVATARTSQSIKQVQALEREGTSAGTGSVTFRIALTQLLRIALKHPPSPVEQQLLGLVGDLTGAASATPSGLTETATLGLK